MKTYPAESRARIVKSGSAKGSIINYLPPKDDLETQIMLLEERARNGRHMAANCLFEARECEAQAKELRRQRASCK